MRSLFVFGISSLIFAGALALTGCSLGKVSVDAPSESAGALVAPPIKGSVFGGHAPLVGAKVYVLTPSKTANYGLATSLMNSTTGAGGSNVTLDSSGGTTSGFYYVTTDMNGEFNLTNDYACTVNKAVYIAAVGGSPTFPSGSNVFASSQIVVDSVSGVGSSQTANFTFTTTTTENFYIGEQVSLSNFGGFFTYLDGTTQTVLNTNLTTTTFAVTTSTNYGSVANPLNIVPGTYTTGGTATAFPTNNPAVVNMAALGLCPPSGTFAGTLSYIYMNEISTAAMAYAMSAFGNDAFHIGVNAQGPLNANSPAYVLNGMKQAMNNASLLYDIGGRDTSSTYAGSGHIARAVTPEGNGVVPQATLDTLGNILAACVDSQNTTLPATSPQCTTLFNTATSDGTLSGTKPADIAGAAFNMAHFPAGFGNTSFVTTLYNLPTGNVPFAPYLTAQPNDFTISLAFTAPASKGATGSLISGPTAISVDGGNYVGTEYGTVGTAEGIWIGSLYSQAVKIFATGTPDYATNTALAVTALSAVRSVAVDSSNNVWMNRSNDNEVTEFSNVGAMVGTYTETDEGGMSTPMGATLDASTNVYLSNSVDNNILKISSSGVNVPANGGVATTPWSSDACVAKSQSSAMDSTGILYTVNYTTGALCALNPNTGLAAYLAPGFTTVGTSSIGPQFISVGAGNGVWGTNAATGQLLKYIYGSSAVAGIYTGGGLYNPCSTAVDGAGNVWIGNSGNYSLSAFTATGTAMSPGGGFAPQGGVGSSCAHPAIDRAGDVWVAYPGTSVVAPAVVYEVIGIAAPTVTPLQFATFNGFIATRPY